MSSIPPEVRRILAAQGINLPQEEATSPAEQTLAELGLTPKPAEGLDLFQPIRTAFGATQGAIPAALGPTLAPEAYAAARAELEKAHGITPTSPWYERTEALPGLGDVAAQFVPESVRQSRLGTALGPVSRLAGNILGDPTTYTPYVLSRATGAIARGVPAASELIGRGAEAELARRSALAAAPLAEGALGPTLGEAAAQAARQAEAAGVARAVLEQGSPLQRALFTGGSILQEAEPIAMGTAAALAYGPAAVRGAYEGWKQAAEGITEQPILDTAAEAANAALQTGLAALMAKGVISSAQAAATWERHLAEQRPAAIEAQVGRVGETIAEAVRARQGEAFAPEAPGPFAPPVAGGPEPIPSAPAIREGLVPEPVPESVISRPIETAPELRATEGEIPRLVETAPGRVEPSAQQAEPIMARPEPTPAPAPRIEEPTVPEPPAPRLEAPAATEEVVPPAEPVNLPVEGAKPVGKVAPEGPAKVAGLEERPIEKITPEYVEGLVRKENDVLAQDPEVERLVKSVFGLGKRERVSARDQEVQGAVTEIFSTPEKRAALAKRITDTKAELEAKGEAFGSKQLRALVMKAARSGEAFIGRKVGQEVVERAAAEKPAPVGKIEAPPKRIANHYDFIKSQIEQPGSLLSETGVKSVGELVEKLPLAERFKPQEIQAYRDYVKARDEGKAHQQALDFVRSQQKNRWSSNQAAANTVNLILKQARELELKKGTVTEAETGRRVPTPEELGTLAREKQQILGHLRGAITSNNVDDIEASVGAWLAHVKKRELFDLKKDRTFLRELKDLATDVNKDERFTGPQVPESARKNATQLAEAIARRTGIAVKAAGAKAKEELAQVGRKELAALKEKKAAALKKGAIPLGPGGFETLPTRPNVPGVRYKGRNGLEISFIKADGTVRVERVPEGVEAPALKEDLNALREDPDVKRLDLHEDLPNKALDGVLSPEDSRLPAFIEDPDAPKGVDRLIRADAVQDRIAEMDARDVYGVPPSWARPLRAADRDVMREEWEPTAETALQDSGGPLVALRSELKTKGLGDLDLNTPPSKLGAGTYHSVYDLPGTNLVVRVGKSPPFELSTPAQQALVQPTLAQGKLVDHAGEPIFYTVHPKGIVGYDGTGYYQVTAVDDSGRLSAVLNGLDPRLKPKPYDPAAALQLEQEMVGALPPGRSLQEYLDDVGNLLFKAAHADLDIAPDVMTHTNRMATPWGMRGEQFAYFPVDRIDTRGVGYIDPQGQAWQLRVVDAGMLTPWGSKLKEHPVLSQVHETNRIALQEAKPQSRLSLDEITRQVQHYDEDARDAEVIGEGLWNANHDRVATQSFVDRHGELGAGAAQGLKKVVGDLVGRINDQYDVPAEGKLNVEYRGLTSSPHLSGLYHEPLGGGPVTGHIYSNISEAVAAAKDYDGSIDNMLHTVVHEVVHNKSKGHGEQFQTLEEYVRNLLQAQNQMETYRAQLKEAFPEAQYERVRSELVPEFMRMRREYGYRTGSWRDNRAFEGVPAGPAEGGAQALQNRPGRGEEAAPGNLPLGVQPGRAVPGGDRGPAEGVRATAAPGGSATEGLAEGEAARLAARRDPLEEIKSRIAEYGTKVGDEKSAKTLLHQMVEGITKLTGKAPSHNELHEWAWALAGDLTKVMHPKDLELRANSLPRPTKPGQIVGPINMLHYVDLPVETKARIQIWGDLTQGLWPKDTPQRWEDVDREVQNMLGLHTPEQWAYHYRNQNGGPTAKDLLIMRQVSDELARRVTRAEEQLYHEMSLPDVTPEKIEQLQDAVNAANRSAVEGGLMMAGGGTKAGRALAILGKDIRAMNPQIAFQQDLLAGLRERTQTRFRGDKKKAEETAQALYNEFMRVRDSNGDWGEFAKAYRAMLGSNLWPDKILEFYKAGLLGWPSRVANMASNALLRGVRLVEDAVAAGLDATGSKLTGRERETFLGEASVSTLALRRAWAEAMPEWWGEMKRNALLQPDNFQNSLKKGSMMEDLLQHGGAIGGKVGEFLRFHLKGMGADDALAKQFIRTDNLYRQIYRRVRKGDKGFQRLSGETHAQATERIFSDLRTNWQKALEGAPQYDFAKIRTWEPMMKEAEATARKETFQEELNNMGKGIQSVLREHPFLQVFMPFFRTPWNITKETLARTPLGFIDVAREWKKLTPAQQMSALSRPLTGSVIGLGALSYAMAGGATGGGPIDPDERAMLESTGWQPYSAKIGNQYISYQRLEPIASILGVGADAAEGIRNGDFQSARSGFLRVMQSAAENVTNKTFLSGLDALTSAISHPNQFTNSFIKRMQASLIPNSLGYIPVSGLARALDRTYRQTDPMTMSAFYAKLPFLSSTLEPQYGPSGEERQRPGTALEQIISPFARVKLEAGPARVGAEEVVRLSASPKAPRRYWVAPGGLRVDFKPEERKVMAEAMQSATRFIGERLIKDPTYLALPDNEMDPKFRYGGKTKETVVKSVYDRYRQQVMQRIKPGLVARGRKTIQERT